MSILKIASRYHFPLYPATINDTIGGNLNVAVLPDTVCERECLKCLWDCRPTYYSQAIKIRT